MSLRRTVAVLAVIAMAAGLRVEGLRAQDAQGDIARRVKSKVAAVYPELARKMNIVGTVKVEIVVSPSGAVKDARVIGGHPVLASVSLDAAKKWRFEPASVETTGVIDFRFEPR